MFWRKRLKSQKKGVNYICPDCGAEEIIPYEVLEDFDMMYPEELLKGPHQFRCEKCKKGDNATREIRGQSYGSWSI